MTEYEHIGEFNRLLYKALDTIGASRIMEFYREAFVCLSLGYAQEKALERLEEWLEEMER